MQVIVFQAPDNPTRVAIMTPTGEVEIDELVTRYIDTSKPYKIMSTADFPHQDGDYSEAWQLVNDALVVNMDNAKEAHRNKLRVQRTERFAILDIDFMRAVEQADTAKQQEIAAIKQKLRDMPAHPSIAAATTTAELRALTMDALLALV